MTIIHRRESGIRRTLLLLVVSASCSGQDEPIVTLPTAVASVTVAPNASDLVVGGTQTFAATVRDAAGNVLDGRPISWSTSNHSIASVDATGLVQGLTPGVATITATSQGKEGSAVVSVSSILTFAAVVTGGAHTCALTLDRAAYCWGRGESGQLGVPVPATVCAEIQSACSMVPVAVRGGISFALLSGGGAYTCGLTNDGTAYCWGANDFGQLGDKSFVARDTPVPVSTALKFMSINAGEAQTCAVTSGGAAYCWGRNDSGQVGDGTMTNRSEPVPVSTSLAFTVVDAGGYGGPTPNPFPGFTCGLTTAGDAHCWGENTYGNLGQGMSGFPQPYPSAVAGSLKFTHLTVGLNDHACALTAGGQAYCWGANFRGSLGNGTTTESAVPLALSGGLTFVQLAAGGFFGHTCGRSTSGAAYCWGDNEVGQAGDGSTAERLTPVPVTGGLIFTSLDAGYRHTCGRTNTGIVYCWGSNRAGQLGTNSVNPSSVPTRVHGQAETAVLGHAARSADPHTLAVDARLMKR
jgi:alpha-tubulin suppressor-like RCC1 family protein